MAESIISILHVDRHTSILKENKRNFQNNYDKVLVCLKPQEKFPEKFLEITESFLVLCQIIVSFSFSLSLPLSYLPSSTHLSHLLIYSHLLISSTHIYPASYQLHQIKLLSKVVPGNYLKKSYSIQASLGQLLKVERFLYSWIPRRHGRISDAFLRRLMQRLRDISKRADLQISETSPLRFIKDASSETSLRSLRSSQRRF